MMNVVTDPLAVADRLRPAVLKLRRHLRREVQDTRVTGGQAALLANIAHRPGVGIRELAELESVSTPRMSKAVQVLVEAGLVTSERGSDRRRVGLAVTSDGTRLLQSIKRRRTAWLVARLGELEEHELEAIENAIPYLEKLTVGE